MNLAASIDGSRKNIDPLPPGRLSSGQTLPINVMCRSDDFSVSRIDGKDGNGICDKGSGQFIKVDLSRERLEYR